jgi:PAS domain S-box-containing protein
VSPNGALAGRTLAKVICVLALAVGLSFFAAYLPRDDALTAWASTRMKTNTALSLILLAAGVYLQLEHASRAGKVLALSAAAIGTITLLQYVLGANVGLDELFAKDVPAAESAEFPNRMSPNAALGIVFMGLSIASVRNRARLASIGQGLALSVLAIGLLAVIGYLYGAAFLYRPTVYVRISPYTASVLCMLSVAVLALRTDVGFSRFILSRGQGGYLARRLMLVAILAPVVFGWVWLQLERIYQVPPASATALFVISMIVTFLILIGVLSRSLDVIDARRQQFEADLQTSAELTAALARAATIEEVTEAVMEIGLRALGADAGSLSLVSSDHTKRVIGTRGYAEGEAAGANELTMPLEGRGRTIGVLALRYAKGNVFSPQQMEKVKALTWHSGQALDRALLFDAEKTALQETALAQRELRAAGDRLHAALEAAAIGTYFWDLKSGDVQHDAGVKKIFGFAAEEGNTIDELTERIHPGDRALWSKTVAECAARGEDFEMRYRIVLPDGSERWLLDKGHPLRDEALAPQHITGAIVDFTAEQHAKSEAEAANRAKDEFLAMLGHELRNPLAPIAISLQLMKLRGDHLFDRERAVIARQVEHMTRLVDDLLDVSRITRGKVELKIRRIELSAVATKAIELVSPLFEARGHALSVDVPESGLPVNADEHRLTQAISNLLTNAAKYTHDGGKIHLKARRVDGRVVVCVKDDGIGISAELLPRIFELFVQGERTLERADGGLGLGLSIVKTLIELHGGKVFAASDGPGKGAELSIMLPLAEVRDEVPPPTEEILRPSLENHTKRCILVVDDNRDAAASLAELLSLEGHRVVVAFDGPTALTRADENTPQLAFLDIGLPLMDGYEVARRLRERFGPKITLVAVTGYGQESDRRRSQEAGFDEHLVKPIELERTLRLAEGSVF